MRFNEFNEGIDPGAKAAIKGMRELSNDQYYGLYKTMKDVAGHDGEKQTAPEGATDHEVSDKPFAYAYTDEEKNMIKGVDPKAKQITSDKSEELDEGVAEGSLNEGQYEMMMRNGQVKKFIAKDDADAKRIAAGHGAKSVIKLRGGVPAGKVAEQGVAEAGNNYHANRTGFAKPQGHRDDERHDLDVARPLIYGLKINGKIWQKDGNAVTFFTKERALAARNSILAKRPELEVGLVQRPQD
jgi:hypothetical protein